MGQSRLVAEREGCSAQFIHRKVFYEVMTRCFEATTIISKIVPCGGTQTHEKLLIASSQTQMSMIFPKPRLRILEARLTYLPPGFFPDTLSRVFPEWPRQARTKRAYRATAAQRSASQISPVGPKMSP